MQHSTIIHGIKWCINVSMPRKGLKFHWVSISKLIHNTVFLAENAHITCSPGAGHYRKVSGDVGSATRRSMSARHRDGVHVGYPNSLIQPVDTLGFATPGPDLWLESERGREKTFGAHTPCNKRQKPQKLFFGHGKEKCSTSNLLSSDFPPVADYGGPGIG